MGPSLCQDGVLSKEACPGGGKGASAAGGRACQDLPGISALSLGSLSCRWMEVGEGVAHHSQDSENKERARLAQTKLTPCEIQRWLGACLGTVYMVWTPNLEKN